MFPVMVEEREGVCVGLVEAEEVAVEVGETVGVPVVLFTVSVTVGEAEREVQVVGVTLEVVEGVLGVLGEGVVEFVPAGVAEVVAD